MAAAGWRGDAAAFVTDADDRALFIRHEEAPGAWGLPDDVLDPFDERVAAWRE